ncbi:MAG: phytoene/squalene synthase family protein [Pyrinomonadaceae bacterium]|nr:phytoene/squalene synthase family protein [Pyrinomonadaceae bacterium]
MNQNEKLLAEGFQKCQEITRHFGTSYYFATQFFPREVRLAIYAVYAFARIPDEFVDNPENVDLAEARKQIEDFRDKWRDAMENKDSADSILLAIAETFNKYKIPMTEGEAFFDSMLQDTEKMTYSNYAELENYMYGSAGVIGLMVTRIVGYSSEDAFKHALQLGYAFQLTNFLRDIREDWDVRQRIYIPQDELAKFGLSNEDIANHVYDEKFIALMKFQIERNREIYRESLKGIPMLKLRGRMAVKISYVLYSGILSEIEKLNYNVFKQRARTSFVTKLKLSAKALIKI